MPLTQFSETDECLPWYDEWEAILLTAEFLASQNAPPLQIVSLFKEPWSHTLDYQAALSAGVEFLCDG